MTLNKYPPHQLHAPVLLAQTLNLLKPAKGESYLDLTAGYGGHAQAVLEKTGDATKMTLVDRDPDAISSLKFLKDTGAKIIAGDYLSAALSLEKSGATYDMILLDLGVSSPQLDIKERGFSFMLAGPLDMRMDQTQELSAATIVNTWPENELAGIIGEYGQEPFAGRIARSIIRHRPFKTTKELSDVIVRTVRRKVAVHQRRHPATRTFQALRIAVNDELNQLRKTLPILPDLLKRGGRLAVISFHSLEDRIVKRFITEETRSGYEARLKVLTKHPLEGADYEVFNPRARSAKLRAAAKIKSERKEPHNAN